MANEKFSEFNSVTTLDGTESLVGLQSADNSEFSVRFFPITVKTSVSSAEILTMFSSPITLVNAPGAGRYVNLISVAFRLNFATIAYATNYQIRLQIGSVGPLVAVNNILAQGSTFFMVSQTMDLGNSGSPDWVNAILTAKVIDGNPTTGDSSLDIYTTYNIITL